MPGSGGGQRTQVSGRMKQSERGEVMSEHMHGIDVCACCAAGDLAIQERDEWKRRANEAEEKNSILRSTLRSDEEQQKQWVSRHAEMREDVIRTANERDALAAMV